jgi:PE-PPE domain
LRIHHAGRPEQRTIAATLANYIIGVGGNNDPTSGNINHKLDGQYADAHGVHYLASIWPVSGLTAPTFAQSVSNGNVGLGNAISAASSPNTPGDHIVVVGYSLGAVLAKQHQASVESDHAEPPEAAEACRPEVAETCYVTTRYQEAEAAVAARVRQVPHQPRQGQDHQTRRQAEDRATRKEQGRGVTATRDTKKPGSQASRAFP